MANNTRKHTQHGVPVTQVNFGGNWYTPVDDRILIANHADIETVRTQPGYHVVDHSIVPMGERWAYTCTVEYPHGSGHFYPGSDFIDMATKDGLAKAETSAIGRALGLAGIAIESGIASAEEMSRVHHEASEAGGQRTPQPHQSARPARTAPHTPAAPASSQRAPEASASAETSTPADNITAMDAKIAGEVSQRDLAAKLRSAQISTSEDARERMTAIETFIARVIRRQVDVLKLAGGTADITVGELRKVIAAVAEHNQKRADAQQPTAAASGK